MAVAPNASSGIICSGTSPSIEPYRANVYTHKTLSGSYQVKNKFLEKLLKSKEIGEDEEKSFEKNVQLITDKHIAIVDEKILTKEKEIMTI